MPSELTHDLSTVSQAFSQGLLLMASLIVALGAQNTWVLRQGLRREQVGPVVATCIVADISLTAAGVFGLGAAMTRSAALVEVLRVAGVLFLLAYALRAAWRAWHGSGALEGGATSVAATVVGPVKAVSLTLAVTLLNPHVYLDTVVLVGAVGAAWPSGGQLAFVAGAGVASAMWFVLLGFGAQALAPSLQRPLTWRVLDAVVAVVMVVVAARLWWGPL